MIATYPAAVISFFISAAYTLYHHQALGVNQPFFSSGDLLLQLQESKYPIIFPIKVFGGFIFFSTSSDDGYPMVYLLDLSSRASVDT
jgi:hypothetical protein